MHFGNPANHIVMKKTYFLITLMLMAVSYSQAQSRRADKLCQAAISLTRQKVIYDPAYFSIPYPNGDVPSDKGVCTDVIIRAYRQLGVDLQKEVHEDMILNFSKYPKDWGAKQPDKNIDHRRVPNLMVFFTRKGCVLPVS